MCGTIDPGSCIRRVLGFGIKTGYDTALINVNYFNYLFNLFTSNLHNFLTVASI
jgi:hypothetical protein